ncbi:predicted protein [Coccidioides posadasii str. Silveira]|uniref:Predicted protein n=1 Tax=Coccidioides posadasii (strain RMSCC 757 / Silveira) TaxID=443226 RepID=E9CTG0_COCPS|nr:predicted protein [Coccidioides posadasii str. Silveira]
MDFPRQIRQETRAMKMDHNHRPFSQYLKFLKRKRVQEILGILESFAKVSDTKPILHLSQRAGTVIKLEDVSTSSRFLVKAYLVLQQLRKTGLDRRGPLVSRKPKDHFQIPFIPKGARLTQYLLGQCLGSNTHVLANRKGE